jgi:hypothetical protein
MRRPAKRTHEGRSGLPIYEWQLQDYAHLRERQNVGTPVIAGILIFTNELLPTTSDLQKWQSETDDNLTDVSIPKGARWRRAEDVPIDMKLRRAIHVTAVTAESREEALKRFDSIIRKIEVCRALEATGKPISSVWPPNPKDKATCDACDERTFCPGYADRHNGGSELWPTLPSDME